MPLLLLDELVEVDVELDEAPPAPDEEELDAVDPPEPPPIPVDDEVEAEPPTPPVEPEEEDDAGLKPPVPGLPPPVAGEPDELDEELEDELDVAGGGNPVELDDDDATDVGEGPDGAAAQLTPATTPDERQSNAARCRRLFTSRSRIRRR